MAIYSVISKKIALCRRARFEKSRYSVAGAFRRCGLEAGDPVGYD